LQYFRVATVIVTQPVIFVDASLAMGDEVTGTFLSHG